jgi:predicted tellurium resistance membrane protein TerC
MKRVFEVKPIIVAGFVAMGVMLLLISFLDNANTKFSTYALIGFLTGVGVQIGVRATGVS